MRVLVTGARGIIGRHAVDELLRRGVEVHALGRADFDILHDDAQALMQQIKPDTLLHLAWVTEHGKFWHSPANADWVAASLRLVKAFGDAGGKRLVAAGSCAEYDWRNLGDGICREEKTPIASIFPYGLAKDEFRRAAQRYCAEHKISFAWGRIFLVYGEGEPPARLVPSVINALLAGKKASVSHCQQGRDLMSTADCGRAFIALLLSQAEGAFNIASGKPVKLEEAVEIIHKALGGEVQYGAIKASDNEPPVLVADTTRLNKEIGFLPADTLQSGLQRAITYWREQSELDKTA